MATTRDRIRTLRPERAGGVLALRGADRRTPAVSVPAPAEEPGFRQQCHPACFACRAAEQGGLGLRFTSDGAAGVFGVFRCDPGYQGYPDRLHGGIVAMALDAAMTHCLFFQRISAVTARLEVRYRRPIRLGSDVELRARITSRRGATFRLAAEMRQDASLCASGSAVFMTLDRAPGSEESRSGARRQT